MKDKIKHIFFDLDNTLWDTDRNSCLTLRQMYQDKEVNEKYRVNFDLFYTNYYERNERLWALYREEKVTKKDILGQRFKNTFRELGVEDIGIIKYFENNFLDKVIENNHLVEYAVETLQYLKNQGYDLHIVSNGFINPTRRKVEGTPIKEYITTITSGEEIDKRKPAKEVFELGLKKAGALPQESSFIGDDWDSDVKGSENVGMYPIFFDYKKEGIYNQQKEISVVRELIQLQTIF